MRPRSDLVELFSTFLMLEGESSRSRGTWTPDSALRRSMEQVVKTQGAELSPDEKIWAIYWHRRWSASQAKAMDAAQTAAKPDPRARRAANHLIAYLQEPGYWGANKVFRNLRSSQQNFSDLFQSAMTRAVKVLSGFDPVVSTGLRNYAEYAFSNIIKDQLRQRREVDASTAWGLLNRVSRKRLIEALQRGGIQGNLQEQYLLAWSCYREHYGAAINRGVEEKTGLKKRARPTTEIWEKITDTYNRERTSQLTAPAPAITPVALETQLVTTVGLLRNFQNPRAISLDAPLKGAEGDSNDFYSLVPDDGRASPMGELMAQEAQQQRQQQQQQLSDVLKAAIAQFTDPDHALLQAYYGDQLTQGEIAKRLDLKQYSISRKLSRLRQKLLKTLLDWQSSLVAEHTEQASLHTDLSPAVLDAMGNSLEEWLVMHYRPSS